MSMQVQGNAIVMIQSETLNSMDLGITLSHLDGTKESAKARPAVEDSKGNV